MHKWHLTAQICCSWFYYCNVAYPAMNFVLATRDALHNEQTSTTIEMYETTLGFRARTTSQYSTLQTLHFESTIEFRCYTVANREANCAIRRENAVTWISTCSAPLQKRNAQKIRAAFWSFIVVRLHQDAFFCKTHSFASKMILTLLSQSSGLRYFRRLHFLASRIVWLTWEQTQQGALPSESQVLSLAGLVW